MNSVLISIKPKWFDLIAARQKENEARKTRPKIETPFKCYIYCTKDKSGCDYKHDNGANGKVVGEFVCDKITIIEKTSSGLWTGGEPNGDCSKVIKKTMLSPQEIYDYAGKNRCIYLWHISRLRLFWKPQKLSEWGLKRPPQSWCYVEYKELEGL